MFKKKAQETGRSMVEMLGVLAVIGVLSIAGIAGYRYAMDNTPITAKTPSISTILRPVSCAFFLNMPTSPVKILLLYSILKGTFFSLFESVKSDFL